MVRAPQALDQVGWGSATNTCCRLSCCAFVCFQVEAPKAAAPVVEAPKVEAPKAPKQVRLEYYCLQ
jgi:hypothetical protein